MTFDLQVLVQNYQLAVDSDFQLARDLMKNFFELVLELDHNQVPFLLQSHYH